MITVQSADPAGRAGCRCRRAAPPARIIAADGTLELNAGRRRTSPLRVTITGDRPVQVGSHITSSRPMRPSNSIAPPLSGCDWTSPPAPPPASSPVTPRKYGWSSSAGDGVVTGLNNLTNGLVKSDAVKAAALAPRPHPRLQGRVIEGGNRWPR
jgi:hypothetical protein